MTKHLLPQEFGKFKKVPPEYYELLHQTLVENLPRTRRLLSELVLSMKSGKNEGNFYVPIFDDFAKKKLSGMVLSLCQEFPEPKAAFSYFSKEQDVSLMHQLVDASVDWNQRVDFLDVCDWHVPELQELCRKRSQIKYNQVSPLWELTELPTWNHDDTFLSKLGHQLRLEQLGPEHGDFINDNWKFRTEHTLEWIRTQCQRGLAYGVFPIENDDNAGDKRGQPITWIISYKYGALGLLKTREDWRGQGCAKAIVHKMACHMMTNFGVKPYVYIENDNLSSIKLFESIGFVKTHDANWICCVPKLNS